jgi:beta-ketoacyl-acyl-carrier-protein synthase II
MGALTPVGLTVRDSWESFKAGRTGLDVITMMDTTAYDLHVAGELKDFDASRYLSPKQRRSMSLTSQLAVIAAQQARVDANLDLDRENRDRVGVLIGTAGGSTIEETEALIRQLRDRGPGRLSPTQAIRLWPNMTAYAVAEDQQVKGYNSTICAACASSTQSIGEAAEVIRRGAADVMFAGGSESMMSEAILAGFMALRALVPGHRDDPAMAMRPFDANREGFVSAQGSTMMVLESLPHALERGARIYAEVLGVGVSNDIYHMIAPDPEGKGATVAVRQALDSAGVTPADVDYINAHGTATPLGDAAETKVIKTVFGPRAYEVPINSTKSMIGHLMGGAGALEAMVCVMTIQEGIIHPTINLQTPDPECDLDYVPNQARAARVDVALSNSFGLGGQNAALVIGRYGDS